MANASAGNRSRPLQSYHIGFQSYHLNLDHRGWFRARLYYMFRLKRPPTPTTWCRERSIAGLTPVWVNRDCKNHHEKRVISLVGSLWYLCCNHVIPHSMQASPQIHNVGIDGTHTVNRRRAPVWEIYKKKKREHVISLVKERINCRDVQEINWLSHITWFPKNPAAFTHDTSAQGE